MYYKDGDWVKLYLPCCEADKKYLGQTWEIIGVNIRRCRCPPCQHNWSAGGTMTPPADYVLDISPGTEDGNVLLVYEWQLLPPLEEDEEQHDEEEALA